MPKDLSISINIEGPANTGKTMILMQIRKVLQDAGFDVAVPVYPEPGAPDEMPEVLEKRQANWDQTWAFFLKGRVLPKIKLTEQLSRYIRKTA